MGQHCGKCGTDGRHFTDIKKEKVKLKLPDGPDCEVAVARTFLGVVIAPTGAEGFEVEARLKKARQRHAMLSPRLWRSCAIPLELKIKLWRAIVLSCLVWAVYFGCVVFAGGKRVLKNDDTTMRTILLGEWSFEDADTARPMESDRAKLPLRDHKTLLRSISETAKNSTETAFEITETDPTLHMGWLQWLTKGLVLSVESRHDPRVHVEPAATVCQVCGNVFHGVRGPQIHMFQKHK